jgi:hypothetical protein
MNVLIVTFVWSQQEDVPSNINKMMRTSTLDKKIPIKFHDDVIFRNHLLIYFLEKVAFFFAIYTTFQP